MGMNGYTEFYLANGELIIHTECYNVNARHYAEYKLSEDATRQLASALATDDEIVRYLTKKYSNGIGIMDALRENGIPYEVIGRGYEDTSTDV